MNPKDKVGAKKAPLRYVPPALMIAASGPMEDGALKYGPFNWREQPVEVVTYIEAAIRHLLAFLDGQDRAEDSGHYHIDHAIAGLGIVADSRELGTLIDNRFIAGPAADMLRDRDKSARPADAEPKVYKVPSPPSFVGKFADPAPFTGSPTFMCCGQFPEHALECVNFSFDAPREVTVEEWGNGDGDCIDTAGFDSPTGHYPFEEPDGCFNYRGVHVHPSVATEATFRDIDRDIRNGYRPSAEF